MKKQFTQLCFMVVSLLTATTSFAQQGIGLYPNMDGGFQKQANGNLPSARDSVRWSFVSNGNSQVRTINASGGNGSNKFLTVGKAAAATTGSSTTVNSNELRSNTFLPNTLYVIQFHYKANVANAITPDSTSTIFMSADGTSGTRKSKAIKLATPTIWTKFFDTVRTDNITPQAITGVVGINIKTPTIGTACLVDVDNFVVYPSDNQTIGGADITAPDVVIAPSASATSPAEINVSWTAPTTGIDNGGYVVVRYAVNPSGTDNVVQNAIYYVGDSVNNTNVGRVVYVGTNLNFLDAFNVVGNTTYYYKIYTADKAFNYSIAAAASATTTTFANFYYNGTGSLTNVASWGDNVNGTGTAPANFTTAGQYFTIKNASAAIVDAPWIVSGTASKLILGDGTNAITLTVPAANSLTARLDIVAPATGKNAIVLNGGTFPTLGIITGITDLTVGTNVNATIPKSQWGNVVIASPSTATINMGDTLFVQNLTINAGSVFTTTTNAATNNTIPPVTIAIGGAVMINGTFKTGKTAGFIASLNYLGTANTTLGSASTIVYDKVSAATNQTISAYQYANLTITGTSPKAFEPASVKVSGDLLNTNTGAVSVAPASLEFNGSSLQLIDGISVPYGDVTFNGVGLKKLHSNVTIGGAISFTNGKIGVDVDTLFINSTATIGSGSAASYIATGSNAIGKVVVRAAAANVGKYVPVGSANNFLPVTITPTTVSDFAMSAFDGLTKDGSITGAAADAATKAESVDAVWDISRPSGTGVVFVKVGWPAAIEGAALSSFTNTQFGILNYATTWTTGANPTADNAVNTATGEFTTLGSFAISKINGLLPVSKIALQLSKQNETINLVWKTATEVNTKNFIVEKSIDGRSFEAINTIGAAGNSSSEKTYTAVDRNLNAAVIYYRIKIVDVNGKSSYSAIASIKINAKEAITVLSNPVINQQLKLQLNNLTLGNYSIKVYNNLGQLLQSNTVEMIGAAASQTIQLNSSIKSGNYFVSIEGNNVSKTVAVFVK